MSSASKPTGSGSSVTDPLTPLAAASLSSPPAPKLSTPPVAATAATPSEPATAAVTADNDGAEAQPQRRGWEAVRDGRFRIALTHHYAISDDHTDAAPSTSTDAVQAEHATDAAAVLGDKEGRALMCDTPGSEFCATEPHIEVSLEASLVNAINSAYTSTGYPFVATTGNARGSVYGSFVDLSNPSLSSLELPPSQSIIVAPREASDPGSTPAHDLVEMDTLLAIRWGRGDGIMKTAGTAVPVAAAHGKHTQTAAPTGAAGSPHSPAVARTIAHHLSQYPEGIHGINSSPALRQILVEGTLPTTLASTPSAPVNTAAQAPAPSGAEANVPPLPTSPQSNAPVQHTLVSASTFNHVSVYLVAHQDGKLLYTAPIQSLSASIATRKVTAHQLILVGRGEVDMLVTDPFTPPRTMPPKHTRIGFADISVAGEEAAIFFRSKTSRFVDADPGMKTISAAPIRFTVEPHLLLGNQNGDIFVFSLLQERIVQHINYNAGKPNVSAAIASGSNGVGSKLICSPVSCIAEIQNGIEKKITCMVEHAALAKRDRRRSFSTDDITTGFPADTNAAAPSYYDNDVPPSLYAVGFDDGQMLLLCVTCEGGWLLRHFNNQYFGVRPIHSIAVRVPPFYTRLWTSHLPPITTAPHGRKRSTNKSTGAPVPITTLVTATAALIVHKEHQLIAAISCSGGAIALVRLPGMEIIYSVDSTDYNAVGEILALQWMATMPDHLLTPDILVASGEDDTMTAFQLLEQFLVSAVEGNHHNGNDSVPHLSFTESVVANGRLRILEKKRFHRSWVNRLNLIPVAVPAATANAKVTSRSSSSSSSIGGGGGMPQYLGVCLVASSYDHLTSFWPYMFSRQGQGAGAEDGPDSTSAAVLAGCVGGASSLEYAGTMRMSFPGGSLPLGRIAAPDRYVLVDGPTTAYPLHSELVIGVAAAGGGTSFFLVTVCCRGKVKFWSVQVKV
ncbi:hypothetical protein MNV84_00180 [Leishmania braziliensis]|nr:hypothetical protein MNV84_00180 [Leishmania braziliensis]CAJ2466216.1 unnamed protein product [Leishmania braziliensis]